MTSIVRERFARRLPDNLPTEGRRSYIWEARLAREFATGKKVFGRYTLVKVVIQQAPDCHHRMNLLRSKDWKILLPVRLVLERMADVKKGFSAG